jgi:tetratricopeptide (TPR) repeat protein
MCKMFLAGALLGISATVYAQSDSSSLYLQKGLEAKQKGRRAESLTNFEKAYSFNRNDKQVVGELAAAYNDLRRYGKARDTYMELEKLGDQSDSTYRQLMLLSYNTRRFDEAIKYATLEKKVNASAKVAYYIGKANYETENLGDAIKYMTIAEKEEPENPEIPYTVARAYSDMQNFKLAIPYFQKAVALNPTQSRWIYEMSLIYYGMNDDQNALKYMLEAADKGYKKDNEYLQNLSTAYINAGRLEDGINVLKEVLQRRPTDMALLNSIAQAYYDAKKYDDAISYYDQILKIDNKNAESLYMIGMSFQQKGEKEKGMALCDKAIQMDPSLRGLKSKKEMPGFTPAP